MNSTNFFFSLEGFLGVILDMGSLQEWFIYLAAQLLWVMTQITLVTVQAFDISDVCDDNTLGKLQKFLKNLSKKISMLPFYKAQKSWSFCGHRLFLL